MLLDYFVKSYLKKIIIGVSAVPAIPVPFGSTNQMMSFVNKLLIELIIQE